MRPGLLSLTFTFAGLILLSQPVYAASFCIAPDVAGAVHGAEVVFAGKITNVEPIQTSTAAAGDYFVTFKVETWWKGTPSPEMRVLWRSSFLQCPLLPVGEIGEDYLVYAGPSRSATKAQLPEVTIFNRTSRLPPNRKPEIFLINDWKQTRIKYAPELNRADASDDIKLLRVLRACGCMSASPLPPPLDSFSLTSIEANSRETEAVSRCRTCLRSLVKPF